MVTVVMPDGTEINDVPEGVTKSELMRKYQSSIKSVHNESYRAKPVQPEGGLLDLIKGFGSGVGSYARGADQRLAEAGTLDLGPYLPSAKPDPERALALQNEEKRIREEETYSPTYTKAEKFGKSLGEMAPFAASTYFPAGQTALGTAGYAGLLSYLLPTVNNAEKYVRPLVAAPTAGSMQLAFNTFLPRTKIEPEFKSVLLANKRSKYPVNIKAGQITKDPYLQQIEAAAPRNPWISSIARRHSAEQVDRINAQLGEAVGSQEKIDFFSPEVLSTVEKDIVDRMTKPVAAGVFVDPEKTGPIFAANEMFKRMKKSGNAPSSEALNTVQHEIFNKVGDFVSASDWKWVRGRLSEMATKAFDDGNGELGKALKSAVSAWEDMGLSSASDKAAFKEAIRQYANFKTIEESLRRSGKEGAFGNVDPTKLFEVMERRMPGSVLRNRSDLADTARIGKLIKDTSTIETNVSPLARIYPSNVANAIAYLGLNSDTTRRFVQAALENPKTRAAVEQAIKSAVLRKFLEEADPQNLDELMSKGEKLIGASTGK